MPYVALRIEVPGSELDAWSDALLDAGALSVDAADLDAGTGSEAPIYAEPGLLATHWQRARLVALLSYDADATSLLAEAAQALGRSTPRFYCDTLADRDWVRATQSQFGIIAIAPDLHIVPTWCIPPKDGISIRLDPGVAFGTGSHATTRLCLEWLRSHMSPGIAVLDYGCGSGILAIAAAKLGARRVVGTDVDLQALSASIANAEHNEVSASFVAPDALSSETFDIVVANILANPLMLLAPALAAKVRPQGRIALSGILREQAAGVVATYGPWFTLRATREAEGWVLVAGEREHFPSVSRP